MTLVDTPRIENIKKYLEFTKHLPGFMAEVGVYKGGTAKIIAQASPEKHLYLFDTFEGMPEVSKFDMHRKGEFSDTSLQEAQQYLKDCSNVTIQKGLFPDETAESITHHVFSFVHLDCDIYESVRKSLHFFKPRLVRGGVIIVDDYDAPDCPGAKKAVNEYLSISGGGIISFCQCQVVLYFG